MPLPVCRRYHQRELLHKASTEGSIGITAIRLQTALSTEQKLNFDIDSRKELHMVTQMLLCTSSVPKEVLRTLE